MNDFTKEELEDIKELLSEFVEYEYEIYSKLKDKTQSMIDNYCEHEYKKTLDKSGMYFISMCHKCLDSKTWSVLDE